MGTLCQSLVPDKFTLGQPPPLILGSAAWAQSYAGRSIPTAGVTERLLATAQGYGLRFIDSSPLYGRIEQLLAPGGRWRYAPLRLISKIKQDATQSPPSRLLTKKVGGKPLIYALLVHDFNEYHRSQLHWPALQRWQQRRLAEKIGFSLYYPWQLDLLLNRRVEFDLLQLPYNLLDRRFEPYFAELRRRGVEIHLRSIFLQGKLLQPFATLSPFFAPLAPQWRQLAELSRESGLNVLDFCLAHAAASGHSLVLGLRGRQELQLAWRSWKTWPAVQPWLASLSTLACKNENLLVPSHWPPTR